MKDKSAYNTENLIIENKIQIKCCNFNNIYDPFDDYLQVNQTRGMYVVCI